MLTFEQIKELIDLVAHHGLSGLKLERSDFLLEIEGHRSAWGESSQPAAPMPVAAVPAEVVTSAPPPMAAPAPPAPSAPAPIPVASPAPAPEAKAPESPPKDLHILNSPIVGTFYRAPNPDSPSFAEVGDSVRSGQVLCIVEAMKLMNEIESDVDGTVVEVYIENGQPVEYGEPLFAIKVGS